MPPRRAGSFKSQRRPGHFEDYEKRFARVHQHLREGDCYQANLTFPVTAKWQGDPAAIFNELAARQPVRHSAFVNFSETKILSRSPELFFKTDREGWIESLPMKGTARRGRTPASDKAQKRFLASDPKNQSENRMIVDLLRNDISRISEVGTLSVPKLFKIETYETLHQMVSLVRAKLLPGLTVRDIFASPVPLRLHHRRAEAERHADFADTGAEAARHLLRLHRLDRAGRKHGVQRRHPHADALSKRRGGVQCRRRRGVRFDRRGGICRMPAQSPLRAGGDQDFELIETFRYEPERGFIRLDRHLARMAASAETFGFPFVAAHVKEKLQVLADPHEMMRVRLALNAQGGIKVTHQPYAALPPDTVWRLRIAKTRLDSRDPLLRHKTSRREIYEQARAEYSAEEADEVLLLNERDEVCEGCITSLFLASAEWTIAHPGLALRASSRCPAR